MRVCRCGKTGRNHEVTDGCLSPEDQALVRAFEQAYDEAANPWWHQAAGHSTETGHTP